MIGLCNSRITVIISEKWDPSLTLRMTVSKLSI